MQDYVLIDPQYDQDEILLVLKDRPECLNGKLNLVGGKVEDGEDFVDAARRELREESGLEGSDFSKVGMLIVGNYRIHYFICFIFNIVLNPREEETETVHWYSLYYSLKNSKLIKNLKVILPLIRGGVTNWTLEEVNENEYKLTFED